MENRPVPQLSDSGWLQANRRFVAEGRAVVRRVLQSPRWRLRELLVTPAAERTLRDDLAETAPERRPAIQILEHAELNRIGGFNFHQGCLGFADRPETPNWRALDLPDDRRAPVVVLESVRDPDNVGSIFRSALGFGASAVLLGPGCADPLYRKTVRTSMAAVLAVPFGDATPWPETLAGLRAAGYTIVALTTNASADALPLVAASLRSARLAILVGSEGGGLSPAALVQADRRVRIPMRPELDSLNVGTATAIALYALSSGAPC